MADLQALEVLVTPLDPKEFLEKCWEKGPVHISNNVVHPKAQKVELDASLKQFVGMRRSLIKDSFSLANLKEIIQAFPIVYKQDLNLCKFVDGTKLDMNPTLADGGDKKAGNAEEAEEEEEEEEEAPL